jgi:hypothetical protein
MLSLELSPSHHLHLQLAEELIISKINRYHQKLYRQINENPVESQVGQTSQLQRNRVCLLHQKEERGNIHTGSV